MAVGSFNYRAKRAQLARIGHGISSWVLVIEIGSVALLILGIAALFIGLAIGWALIGLVAIPAMIQQWYVMSLRDLKRDTAERSIDARMDGDLLALLSQKPSPKEIAYALGRVNGGIFFERRFGVGGGLLKEVVSENPDDMEMVFEEALRLSDEFGGRVSPGVMIYAMVRQLPIRDTILGHLQLDEQDIARGIQWYHDLETIIEKYKNRPKQLGGIGRDWSFGWIPQLSRFGQNISDNVAVAGDEVRSDFLDQLISTLAGTGGTIALVGRDGSGKTELVHELAARLMQPTDALPRDLWYQQVFMLDASRLLAAAKNGAGLETIVSVLLNEAYTAKNIIVCFDNAELFFEEGVGSVDITALLLPIIEAKRLRIIMTMDEQRFLEISKRTPALAGAMSRMMLQPTDEPQTLKVLEGFIPVIESRRKVVFMYQALKEAYRLSKRYTYDITMPGQAITLLERAAEYPEADGLVTAQSVNKAVEQTTGIKTATASDDEDRTKLLNLESHLHQRLIGQERAVTVVSDALRRARAGVRNQNRPVGTFLFLGPTGVGKTELAKALAETYFNGEDNIIRLDMNEFVSPNDVSRLIADGADDPGSLTAQVMKRPFSVVLLDEIEKAHSSVLTTLLQLLDEGILRDVRGREVSFRDAIVIATSNAGADRIQEYIQRGYSLEQFETTFINELISGHLFHPEFLNRFDEMVVFAPLTKEQLLQVVDLILVGINKTLSGQKITVTVTPEAKAYLVEKGYDPRLGARPMRRVVQRAVENTVATLLLSNSVTAGNTVEITLEQVTAMLESRSQADQIAGGQ